MLFLKRHSEYASLVISGSLKTQLAIDVGRDMGIFATRRQRKNLRIAMEALRDCGIAVSGPYRRPNDMLVFSVAECVLTEDELVCLEHDGKFDAQELQKVLSKSRKLLP